ncbi:MAG: hypothetical protein A4E64_02219 [Syntrophorhabdus sp. PtaU1.Bin058]|nr:MAG: hypothetical protein A4E64_02219 [Syntrophorhabdus sp. PtaU1.Bin058]
MTKRYFLTRRNLRDLVIALSAGSAMFFNTGSAIQYTAFGMLCLGCFIHCVSKGTLIRNVVLCTEGIYRVVRHPYYLANYLIDWSFCLLSGNLFLLLLYPFLFFFAYGPTIRSEEQALFAEHGDSFIKSALKTPQIFPDIGSLRNTGILLNGFSAKRVTRKECFRTTKFLVVGIFLASIHGINNGIISSLYKNRLSPAQDLESFLLIIPVSLLIVFYIARAVVLSMSDKDGDVHRRTCTP